MRALRSFAGIALTGYGMEKDIGYPLKAGFLAHLTKPVQDNALEDAIAAAMPHLNDSSQIV